MTAKERIAGIFAEGLEETKRKAFPQVKPVAEEIILPPRHSFNLPLLSELKKEHPKSVFNPDALEAAICQLYEPRAQFI